MKIVFLTLMIFFFSSLFSQTENTKAFITSSQNIINKDVMTLANQHGIKLKTIEKIMVKDVFEQSCMTTIPKNIGTADVSYINSKVGKIKSCFYLKSLRNDTLKEIYIKTDNAENTNQLIEQALKQYGQTKPSGDLIKQEYNWEVVNKNIISIIKLTVENNLKSVLIVKQKQ